MSNSRKARMARGMSKNIEGFRKYSYRTHEEIIVSGIDVLKNQGDRVFMLTSTHRSHQDYLLISSILEENEIHGLRFAAGDNLLRIPYLSKRFKAMGAFAVHRGKGSQRSYLFKLVEQIKEMIIKGDLITVFPEGGRSYTGHMLDLKGGVIGAPVVLQQEQPEKEVCFVPICISFENPTEVPNFPKLHAARKRRDESKSALMKKIGEYQYYGADLLAFLKRGIANRFGKTYGKVYIDFKEPVPVSDLTDIQGNFRAKAKNSFIGNSASIKECAVKLREIFIENFRVFPMNIVAYAIQQNPNISSDELVVETGKLTEQLLGMNALVNTELRGEEFVVDGMRGLVTNGVLRGTSAKFKISRTDLLSYHAAIIQDNFESLGGK